MEDGKTRPPKSGRSSAKDASARDVRDGRNYKEGGASCMWKVRNTRKVQAELWSHP